jgi:hypothetical protein
MRGLEIVGLDLGSGLIMGDFTGGSGREGRRAWQGSVNVGSSAFHEGRGAGKKTTPGGHDLVNRKKLFQEKEKLREKALLIPIKAGILATLGYLLGTHVLLRVKGASLMVGRVNL